MWKDFFYYSKSERRVIVLLLILAAILVAANIYTLRTDKEESAEATPEDTCKQQPLASGKPMKPKDSPKEHANTQEHKPAAHEKPAPRPQFDPNTASLEELEAQGLSAYVAGNILKYRSKGGKFRTPESLAKIYGLDKETYQAVRPRIVIAKEFRPKERPQRYQRIEKFSPGTIVNINMADTATLKRIPGIGSVLSGRIVEYRRRLGGFHHLSQLQEIRGIDPDMNKWFETGNAKIEKLKVNTGSLDELKQHPYMGYYRAKTIMDYRKRYGKIKDIQIFEQFETFSKEDIEKLVPYLSFE